MNHSFFRFPLVIGMAMAVGNLTLLAETKPNIIYIIVDDMGYGDLSCYGQQSFKTPHIDQIAAEGMKFTSHYSGSTVCAPSRSSLMTGQDQGHTYIRGNGVFQLREQDTTVAEKLKLAGYTTGMVGKSCVTGNTKDGQCPHVCGFDYFYGTLSHVTAHHHWPQKVFENGMQLEIPGNQGKMGKVYIQDRYTEKAIKFIEANKKKPFMLVLSYSVPHADIDAPIDSVKPFIGKFKGEKSYKGKHYKGTPHVKASYAGMVTRLDALVGKVVAKIKQAGIEENTIISFTSDNGPSSAGGYHYEMFNSNAHLRGGKRDLYEGGIRVPFLVKWPGKISAGSVTDHPSAFWDFLPTACELAQVEAPRDIQGISYLPTLLGKKQDKHPYLYWEFHEQGGKMALRKGDWKIVKTKVTQAPNGAFELYNLAEDQAEKHDLAKKYPEKLKQLKALIKKARVQSSVKQWNFETKKKLRQSDR